MPRALQYTNIESLRRAHYMPDPLNHYLSFPAAKKNHFLNLCMYHFQQSTQIDIVRCLINGIPSGVKYPANIREFCLQLSYISQRAYEFLRISFNKNLPDKSTIRAWYANSDFSSPPGVNEKALQSLEIKIAEKTAIGSELICSISVDEMSIRKHIQWCNSNKKMLGFATYGGNSSDKQQYAKQAIVFMLCGVNARFQLPFAYHFVSSINGTQRADLLKEVYSALKHTGIVAQNITSDGLPANDSMCVTLGANFNFNSVSYKPFVEFEDGHRMFVMKDAPHMIKLVRNAIASKKHFSDAEGNDISWEIFVRLVEIGKSNEFNMAHKMNRKHIEWERRIMKVIYAVQTLSASSARCIEYLMQKEVPGFQTAAGVVKFARIFNDLFDIFNTKSDSNDNSNVLKKALCCRNCDQIFSFFEEATDYIKGLRFKDEKGQVRSVIESKIQTGFRGTKAINSQ